MRRAFLFALLALGTAVPAAAAETHTLKFTETAAFGMPRISDREVEREALRACPRGYDILSRNVSLEKRGSGIQYLDLTLKISCR